MNEYSPQPPVLLPLSPSTCMPIQTQAVEQGKALGTSRSSRFSHRRKLIWGMSATPSCFDLLEWQFPAHLWEISRFTQASLGLPYWRTAEDNPSCLQAVVLRGVGLVPVCSGLLPTPWASMGEATVSCKSREMALEHVGMRDWTESHLPVVTSRRKKNNGKMIGSHLQFFFFERRKKQNS